MTQHMRRFFLLLAAACSISAQSMSAWIDVFLEPSSDGQNVYATNVLQYEPHQPCVGCAQATHTYTAAARIIGPTGTGNYCQTAGVQLPATDAENLQCEAELAINGNYGQYTVQGIPDATCTVAGVLVGEIMSATIVVGVSATNYQLETKTGNTCIYSPQDCESTPTCGAAQGYVSVSTSETRANVTCYNYYLQQFGSYIVGTAPRRCIALAYIPPNYFSGPQDAPAPCN